MVHPLFGMQPGSRLADTAEFFIYDITRIFLLLSVIILTVSVMRSYFPPERTKRILSNKKEFIDNILAAFFGIVTPFCSCSAVPLFIGFVEAGVPPRRHLLLPYHVPYGERGGSDTPLGPLWMEDRCHLYGNRSLRRDHLRADHRQTEARKMGRSICVYRPFPWHRP
jgi:hypothetical protein